MDRRRRGEFGSAAAASRGWFQPGLPGFRVNTCVWAVASREPGVCVRMEVFNEGYASASRLVGRLISRWLSALVISGHLDHPLLLQLSMPSTTPFDSDGRQRVRRLGGKTRTLILDRVSSPGPPRIIRQEEPSQAPLACSYSASYIVLGRAAVPSLATAHRGRPAL